MNRYEIANEIHADLPSRADLREEEIWDEIERRRKARQNRKPFDPATDWDYTYGPPPF